MPKPRSKKPQTGTLYVGGSCLGPAERDPATGNIESGPHVTARAAVSGMAVLRVDRSPMNPKRWSLALACGHEVWVTSAQRPKRKTSPCATCPTSCPAPTPPGSLRVWWIPQIPGKPFHAPVADLAQAKLLLTTLARYDLFQLEHRIKPDYMNAGGLEVFEDGEWCEWNDEEGCDIDAVMRPEAA